MARFSRKLVDNRPRLFSNRELLELEKKWSDGIPTDEILALFRDRGFRVSLHTFRKYIQAGLVAPSLMRTGAAGKFKGSSGAYPPYTITGVNDVKRRIMDHDAPAFESLCSTAYPATIHLDRARIELEKAVKIIDNAIDDPVGVTASDKFLKKEVLNLQKTISGFKNLIVKIRSFVLGA